MAVHASASTPRFVALEKFVDRGRHEQVVGDLRDLLCLTPGRLEQCELALHRTTFALLVRRHLERQPRRARQLMETMSDTGALSELAHELRWTLARILDQLHGPVHVALLGARPVDRRKHVTGGTLRIFTGEMYRVATPRQREQQAPTTGGPESNILELMALERYHLLSIPASVRYAGHDRLWTPIRNPPIARVDATPDPPSSAPEADAGAHA